MSDSGADRVKDILALVEAGDIERGRHRRGRPQGVGAQDPGGDRDAGLACAGIRAVSRAAAARQRRSQRSSRRALADGRHFLPVAVTHGEPFVIVGDAVQQRTDPVHPRGHEAHERVRLRRRRGRSRDPRRRRQPRSSTARNCSLSSRPERRRSERGTAHPSRKQAGATRLSCSTSTMSPDFRMRPASTTSNAAKATTPTSSRSAASRA